MTNYSQNTDFSTKDALTTGDPEKIILGADLDGELSEISTAITSKYDSDDIATEVQAEALTLDTVIITPLQLANVLQDNAGMAYDIQQLADPNADRILFWDDSAGAVTTLTPGDAIDIETTGLHLRLLGIENLTDPGADRIMFWDDSAGITTWLTAGTGLSLSGVTLTTNDGAIVHDNLSGFVANEHINHSGVSVLAASAPGLAVANNDLTSNIGIELSLSGLPQFDAADLAAGDEIYIQDATDGSNKAMRYDAAGVRVGVISSPTDTLASGDLNRHNRYTNAGAVTVTLNNGVGHVGAQIAIEQGGAGQVTIAGTATVNAAVGLKTRTQYSVIVLTCVATDTWTLSGDAAA